MKFNDIVGLFKKAFPALTITSTPEDDDYDAEIVLRGTPFTVVVYGGKCSVNQQCIRTGDIYFQHHLVDATPRQAVNFLRKQLK